jgi:Transposase DDE domain
MKSFVRDRILTFPIMLLFFVNLAKKTLQVSLNSFSNLCDLPSVTKQAFSKARKNLSAKAFVLLNRKLLEEYYTDNQYSTWKGFRVLAVDGSDIQLPQKESLKSKFGRAINGRGPTLAMAKLSCAYDVLNQKTLDVQLDRCKSSERDLAVKHIEAIQQLQHDTKDLYIFDRGYPSLGILFYLLSQNKDFLMRCSFVSCFSEVREVVESGKKDALVRLHAKDATNQQITELKKRDPSLDRKTAYIDIRVVVVKLENGEKELLITSLINKEIYSKNELKELYGLRWRKEENYKWYKVGFELENFSGNSELAVEQDIFALIFTANIASLIMEEAQEDLEKECEGKDLKYKYKINKRIAIASLKDELVAGLLDPCFDMEGLCKQLKEEFKKNLCPVRPGRKFHRPKKGRLKYGGTLRRCL